MEYSTGIYILLILIIFSGGYFVSAEIALSKFKAYCDENSIQSRNFLFRLAAEISENIRDYHKTFYLLYFIHIASSGLLINHIYYNDSALLSFLSEFSGQIPVNIIYIFANVFLVIPIIIFVVNILPDYLSGKPQAKFALWTVISVKTFHYLLYPLRLIIQLFEKIFQLLFKNVSNTSHLNSEEELRILIEESTKAGNIEQHESMLIDNIFEFKETVTRQVMTPRSSIVAINIDSAQDEIIEILINEGYSRYPVFSGTIDNIKGILHTKDIVKLHITKQPIELQDLMRDTMFVKEEHNIDDLLRDFQRSKIQMAVVLDDFGGTSGIITMEDILEEIVGEIHDEHDEVSKILETVSDRIFITDAANSVRDLNDLLPEPLPESDDYESIGGLIITETENIPDLNSEIVIGNYKFVILKRTNTKIERVKIIYEG